MHSRDLVFPGGKIKAVTLSYDDGVIYDKTLCEIMTRYGVKGTFNVNSGWFSADKNRMSEEDAFKLYDKYDMEVAIHGEDHKMYNKIAPSNVMLDIIKDRVFLEKKTGKIIKGMAYPYGRFTADVKEIARLAGIKYARTTNSTHAFDLPTDWLELNPTCHHNDKKLSELTDLFLSKTKSQKYLPAAMFYLWGHAYEFNNDGNWDIIETFCKKVSAQKDDIWFATNGEIFDYCLAYSRLEFSADESFVYNPTLINVSFRDYVKDPEKIYTVKSGETLTLK